MRLLIAEDSVILRDGLVALLTRRGHEVVGAVGDGDQLRVLLDGLDPDQAPDVVIIDIRMPPTFTDEGLHAALAIRSANPAQGVLLFSQYVETRFAAQLLTGDARGVGYLLKDRVADVSDFIDALERIADGSTVLDPEVVTQLMGAARADDGLTRLTPRENEVLELMAQGRSNTAIAERLVLSYGAVEKNVSSIFTKLDLPLDAGDHRRVLAVLRRLNA
ncbi:response regulator containing a CheY-like receiver domain and an HTH DNA-binding domain [Sanguibacter keddieii DSM 10542]|uniref:Response regulator containing a CheY-like receiver domain and an HTH DNA-binding domain n=1 Tax=Sanguibacter keddieii (strain ATCC 51767 / DSM 10542 / NCFB 3025 / ST-74) TaxID=446469 RepID=D1BCM5_SANKS|nr:response regulator transcription factor [Sanguibacter keddieii]ACZ20873.1 response regulator containing a CheY-like receiver domain and an HTH DNA-binding domain [Sanguibacter keddieii DSM 10542]